MGPKELLFEFENKYPFLYAIRVDGVPVYTCHRDAVLARLQKQEPTNAAGFSEQKGRVFPKRILDGVGKMLRMRKNQTLIFTSSIYRRDEGRNLAAEYLMEEYPDAVVFEWPSRTEAYDAAYFSDPRRDKYCPLDFYIVCYKLYRAFFRHKYRKWVGECRRILAAAFSENWPESEAEQAAVEYLMEAMPETYAATACSHAVFRWLFKGHKNVRYAIDFWGSARENIIPVLPGKPESIELQHGIITSYHPGYVYPAFAKDCDTAFFKRTLLVYGEKTKQLLTQGSIFDEKQIRVIGNPRIKMYKQLYTVQDTQRKIILFASQTYEQDGTAENYYDTVIPFLQEVDRIIRTEECWRGYSLAIKLHPRENDAVRKRYEEKLPFSKVYGRTSQLYEVLADCYTQLTVSSTTLFEAAEFDTPTITIQFNQYMPCDIYGFDTIHISDLTEVGCMMSKIRDTEAYNSYLFYLKEKTKQFM